MVKKTDPNYHARKQNTKYKVGDWVEKGGEVFRIVKANKTGIARRDTYTLEYPNGQHTNHWWHNNEIKLAKKPPSSAATTTGGHYLDIANQLQKQMQQAQPTTSISISSLQNLVNKNYSQSVATYTFNQSNQLGQSIGGTPNMPAKFKVGDIVRVNSGGSLGWGSHGVQPGDTGTVINVASDGDGLIYYIDIPGKQADWIGRSGDLDLYSGPVYSTPKVEFDSVIMPDTHRQHIMDALNQVDDYDLIFNKWGFGDIMEKGKAISMLFWGPPGTGKTLCAQAIADHLNRKLKIIGTADIESSSPGQAERNLKAYFSGARDTVLLFDECDSLVYSRDSVGSILGAQVNQLLTSLENFEGVVIFTTNRLGVLDEAFNRRLSLKLQFPMPTQEQRVLIWKRMFPKQCPLAKDIDWNKLAELEITGGYIKNIVLRAARSAASQKLPKITYKVIQEATKAEINSMQEFESAKRRHRSGIGVAGINEMGERIMRNTEAMKGLSNG